MNQVHTTEDHVIGKNTAKHLKVQQKQLIRDTVNICPSQSAKDNTCIEWCNNVIVDQESSKHIDIRKHISHGAI